LLQSSALSTITMIDEPEVSLHPELLRLLADLMRAASKKEPMERRDSFRSIYPFFKARRSGRYGYR
jgi:predicted ATP-dependent endonuclease of OLD family